MRPLHLFIFPLLRPFWHYYSFVAVDLESLHIETIMVKSIYTEKVAKQSEVNLGTIFTF